QKFFVASDHVESQQYRTLTPDDLFDIVVRHHLHFGQTRQTGVVFHMMSALGELGRLGLTAVGNSHEEAKATYDRAISVLNEETGGGARLEDADSTPVSDTHPRHVDRGVTPPPATHPSRETTI